MWGKFTWGGGVWGGSSAALGGGTHGHFAGAGAKRILAQILIQEMQRGLLDGVTSRKTTRILKDCVATQVRMELAQQMERKILEQQGDEDLFLVLSV